VFFGCLSLTILCLLIGVIFSILVAAPSDSQSKAISTCFDISKFGAGAIFGLLGGKLAK